MKKASLQIFTAILVLGLFCGAAIAAPSTVSDPTPSQNSTVTGTIGATQAFTIPLNENATVIWTEDGVDKTVQTDSEDVATLTHVFKSGSYQVTARIEGVGQIAAWNVIGTEGTLSITKTTPEKDKTTGIDETQQFSIETNKAADFTWYMDGQLVDSASEVTSDTYQKASSSAAKYNITVVAQNGTETASYQWDWTVSATALPINLDPAEGTVEVSQGKSKIFNVNSSTNDQDISVNWLVEGDSQKIEGNVTSSSYEFKGDSKGNYTLEAVISDPNGVSDSSTKKWTVSVGSTDDSSGNRIWEEGMPTTYTWDAQSYSGFYYDLDTGVSSEEMTITDIGRSIDSGNIEYVTRPTETDFEYSKWGSYQVIGFMADKYFAGYSEENSTVIADDVSPISDGILSKILIDNNDKKSAYTGDSIALEEGYSLNILEVDVNGKSVWVQLEKNGDVVDDAFVSSGDDYVYKTKLGESEDVPIIIAHFGTVFAGSETSAAFVEGLFQISDNYVELENGDPFGEMEVTSLSSSEIKMENEDNIGLDEGETIDLMGKIKLQVADNSDLRFAPILDTSESGTYELRGTVYDEDVNDALPSWTPFNFEGFYYNIDEGIGTENLTVEKFENRDIPSGDLVYKSTPQAVEFEHGDWGNFTVVGFMADKYFAGYPDGAVDGTVDDVSLLSNNILCKVLTDTDDKESMNSGSALTLEDGYSLNTKEVDINGKSVWVQLEKDGDVVDEAFVTSGEDYVYKTDIGKATDIPLIIVHFGTVFAGSETSAVFVQGIFQISDDYTEINNGDPFGEMEVSSVSESGITMKNDDDIGLGEDETVEIMGNVSFKTADDSTLRFYPFVEVAGGSNSSQELKISVPDEIVVGDTFDIGVTAGENPVEGAAVKVNESSAGKTNANGNVEYTAESAGALKLTAEKDGYTTANKNINVIPPKEKMTINISPETVYIGDTINIEAVKAIGGDPIEGANVSINGNALNKTGSDGKIAYTTEKNGTLKVSVTKEGFLGQDINVKVKDFEAIFKFSNLVIDPLEVSAGKDTKISVDVGNTGNAAGNKSIKLSVNGNVTDSQEVSLDVDTNTTVTFEHVEEAPGNYTVEVEGETATYIVKEKSSVLLYALGAIVLLIIGGAAYFFTKGGGDMATLQKKVEELIKSVNIRK
ncbi:S-layer protein domain-containing protein [Methanosarcina sp. Z-7115]|uniref:S-layer protein domain-containing protein n=1 Tax=Methanosarcina baikalica TaxID=3073890 RepID=A0ABU2D2T1_9EURY|nr:S-layer protein domain-containing protein [Methanosarcina sp. Z-7115]MDR7666291.1 S-layer protein domain-containing protein [Methanosarcina sp. Z-7115]